MICLTCNVAICSACMTTTHRGHNYSLLAPYAETCRSDLQHICDTSDQKVEFTKQMANEFKRASSQESDSFNSARTIINMGFDRLIKVLVERKESILKSINSLAQRSELPTLFKKANDVLTDLNSLTAFSVSLKQRSDADVTDYYPKVVKSMETVDYQIDDFTKPPAAMIVNVNKISKTLAQLSRIAESIDNPEIEKRSLKRVEFNLNKLTGQKMQAQQQQQQKQKQSQNQTKSKENNSRVHSDSFSTNSIQIKGFPSNSLKRRQPDSDGSSMIAKCYSHNQKNRSIMSFLKQFHNS